jgi:ABC-type bacteriocin/lantibiotic exporter with double-glycine peptidase domain
LFHDTIFKNLALGDESVDRERAQRALEIAGAWEFVATKPRQMDTIVGERAPCSPADSANASHWLALLCTSHGF